MGFIVINMMLGALALEPISSVADRKSFTG